MKRGHLIAYDENGKTYILDGEADIKKPTYKTEYQKIKAKKVK